MDDRTKDLPETEVFEEEYDVEDNIVELTDEDGVTTAFEYHATIELDGEEYVVLMQADADEQMDEEEGSVVIMKIEQAMIGIITSPLTMRRRPAGLTCSSITWMRKRKARSNN